ncbi:hypothetical protein DL98DRAFT_554173 [Cadophora sp. DSE1049]|nr:hypothetical protein DL98DRAFT_554173 [Cadophora sp. DSE1049]
MIKLVAGNLDTIEDVFKKARKAAKALIWRVFSVQNTESKERQGKGLIDAALKNGIKIFVYSSVDLFTTSWQTILVKEQKLQLIATSDIGFFGAESFLKPNEYSNKKLLIAGDKLTFDQLKDIFENQTSRYLRITYTLIAGILNRTFRDIGYGADILRLKTLNLDLKDFKTWLATESAWKRK